MPEIAESIASLRANARTMKRKHFSAAARLERTSNVLGISVAVISIFLGSNSVLALLPKEWNPVVGGLLGFSSALLVSLQTFLKPRETASGHRNIGNKYTAIYAKCDHLAKKFADGLVDLKRANTEFERLRDEYDTVNHDAADLPTNKRDFAYARSPDPARTDGT